MSPQQVTVKCAYCGKVNRATPSLGKTKCAKCGVDLFKGGVPATPVRAVSRGKRIAAFVVLGAVVLVVLMVVIVSVSGGGSMNTAKFATVSLDAGSVTQALKGAKDITGVAIKPLGVGVATDGEVTVTWSPKSIWDEDSLVENAANDSVSVFRILFANPATTKATFIVGLLFTDSYGKQSNENAVTITYSQATAAKIDWANFPPSWDKAYQVADYYLIHPGIYSKLDNAHLDLLPQSNE